MMTAEPMPSKRPVTRFTVALFLLKLFSGHTHCIHKYFRFRILTLEVICGYAVVHKRKSPINQKTKNSNINDI